MIIRCLQLENFGIYSGMNQFDLTPVPAANFHRPIVLFRGKNGVGKTTFVEAMRLCLHGSLVLGSRVGQQEFDDYLHNKIHRIEEQTQVDEAAVEIEFDHVGLGKKQTYRVRRAWRARRSRVERSLSLWEDGIEQTDMDTEEAERFLRELIPPGILDIFFFDGERVQTLSESGEAGSALLAETLRSLLGIDLVDQLSRDLDIYIGRQESHGEVTGLQVELEDTAAIVRSIRDELETLREQRETLVTALDALHEEINTREQELASQGGQYAAQRDRLLAEKQKLQEAIEAQSKAIRELCCGLMPFAIAPRMLNAVTERLELEQVHEQTQAARTVLSDKLDRLQADLASDEYWEALGFVPEPLARQTLYAKLSSDLDALVDGPTLADEDVVLRVSNDERRKLQRWIEQALHEVSLDFAGAVEQLSSLQEQQATIEAALTRAPDEESLHDVIAALGGLNQQAGAKEAELDSLTRRIEGQESRLTHYEAQLARIRKQINEREAGTSKLYLATRSQELLSAYKAKLAERKIAQVEELLVRRFNQLCRKETFLDRVVIDPLTFQMTLYRLGRRFSRQQLSAGENQLFATATLWALREVSRRPVPVVIDTPLSRLDSEHRQSMVQGFYPHTSHQLIILATDAEIDDATLEELRPAISHVFEMEYDAKSGSMNFWRDDNLVESPQLIGIEEVTVA